MNTHTIAHTTSLAPLGLHPLKKTHRLGRWVSFFLPLSGVQIKIGGFLLEIVLIFQHWANVTEVTLSDVSQTITAAKVRNPSLASAIRR